MKKVVVLAVLFILGIISVVHAQCPYTSVQARVQKNEADPWKPAMSITLGQSFRVGAFKNGWGQFVDCCTTISVTQPNGGVVYPANGTYITATLAGTYTLRVTCDGLSDTATVTTANTLPTVFEHCYYGGYSVALPTGDYRLSDLISRGIKNDDLSSIKVPSGFGATLYEHDNFQGASWVVTSDIDCFVASGWNDRVSSIQIIASGARYDMLDYMMHDLTKKADVLEGKDNGQPIYHVIRDYNPEPSLNRFYIVKNDNGTDYEEYDYDASWIYLVRDTSWEPACYCSGQHASFEYWTGGRNHGQRFPRWVQSGQKYTGTLPFIIKARLEGNGCTYCASGCANDNPQSNTFKFTYLGQFTFPNQKTLPDVMKIENLAGPGEGETYYYSKTKGFVGYSKNANVYAYWVGPANNGDDYEIIAAPPCSGAAGCTWYQSRASNVYHQTGKADGYDWSANTTEHSAGYLSYGPYDPKWGIGKHTAWFYLMIDNNSANNGLVATIDVVTDSGQRVLARRNIGRKEFSGTYAWQWFGLDFFFPSFEEVEVRIYWYDIAYIKHGGTYICK